MMLDVKHRNLANVIILVVGFAILAGLLDLRVRKSLEGQILLNRAATTQAVADVRADIDANRAKLDELLRRLPAATEPSR